jgi:glutathione S-transferase
LGRVLDEHLEGKQWVAQDRLTLADLAIASALMVMGPARLPVTDRANLVGWFGRVQALDAWKKTSV